MSTGNLNAIGTLILLFLLSSAYAKDLQNKSLEKNLENFSTINNSQQDSSCPKEKTAEQNTDKASRLDGSFIIALINPENDEKSYIFFDFQQYLNHQKRGDKQMDYGHSMDLFATNNTLLQLNPHLTSSDLDSLSKQDWVQLVTSTVGIGPGHAAYPSLEQIALIRDVLFQESEEAILQTFTKSTSGMSYSEKSAFLKRVLATIADGYDDLRTIDGSENSKGSVSLEKVMATWRHNVRNKDEQKAGVCRDIAQAGLKLANAMKVEVNYALGYQTTGDGHHRIVMISEGKGKGLDQFNYGEHIQSQGERGIKALEFNGSLPSNGIKYRIYNHYSELATILPSELGLVLNEVTGGDDETLTVSPTKGFSKHQVGYQTKDFGRFRAFYTRSARGTTQEVSGVSYDINKEFFKVIELDAGGVAYNATRDTYFGRLDNTGVGVRLSPKFKLDLESEKTASRIKLKVSPQYLGIINCSEFQGYSCEGNNDSHKVVHAKLEVDQGIGPYLRLRASTQGNLFFYPKESTDSESEQQSRFTNYSFGAGVDILPSRNWRVSANGRIIYTDLGDRISSTYIGELDIDQKAWKFNLNAKTFGTQDRLIPEFIPGAEKMTTIQIQKGFRLIPVRVGAFSEIYHDDFSQNIFGVSFSN